MFLDHSEKEKIEQLQTEVLKLHKKNTQLEKLLAESNAALSNKDDASKKWANTPITKLDLSHGETPSKRKLEVVETLNETEDDIVLEFSPAFQAVLEKHAKACDS